MKNKLANSNKPQLQPDKMSTASEPLDVSLLDYNLSLTPEQRLENHQRALELLNEILKARKELYGESESAPETTT